MEQQALNEWIWKGPHWSYHQAGKNYLAKIVRDENSHTGLQRHWQPRSKGKSHGFVWRQMAPGDAFEIGSHDVDASGNLKAQRTWGVIDSVDSSAIAYYSYPDAKKAIEAAEKAVVAQPAEKDTFSMLQRGARDIRERIDALNQELSVIRDQMREVAEEGGAPPELVLQDVLGVNLLAMTSDEASNIPEIIVTADMISVTANLQDKAKAMLAPPTPSQDDEDDDEDELSPEQLAALRR